MMEIPGYKAPFTPQQAASQTFPLQFLCDFAYAVLDNDTGNLLEYRHLIKHPKYKDTWSNSFEMEIRQLATITETIFFTFFLWNESSGTIISLIIYNILRL